MARPKRIFITRHGESEGNVDESVYLSKPDHLIQLTQNGVQQAVDLGRKLRSLVPEEQGLRVYSSPYVRTQGTTAGIINGYNTPGVIEVRMDPRLREQEFGRIMDPEVQRKMWRDRDEYGRFYYRIDNGESGADVYDRVSDFISSFHRDFASDNMPDNVLLVSHGITARIFLMRWFHFSAEEFEALDNLKNCELLEMRLRTDGHYELVTPLRVSPYAKYPVRAPYFNWSNPLFKIVGPSPTKRAFSNPSEKIYGAAGSQKSGGSGGDNITRALFGTSAFNSMIEEAKKLGDTQA